MIMEGLDTLSQVGTDQLTTSLCFEYQTPTGSGNNSSMLGCHGRGTVESTEVDSRLNTPIMGTPGVDTTTFSFINPDYDMDAEALPITGEYYTNTILVNSR